MSDEGDKRELDEPMRIIAHDLRAPLRHVREFTHILLEELADKVSEAELVLVQKIEDSLDKCQQLLEAVSHYSRLQHTLLKAEQCDAQTLLAASLERLSPLIKQHHALIEHPDTSMTLTGDKRLLGLLCEQLIANAVLFHGIDEQPKVSIRWQQAAKHDVLIISDQGIGIAPQYHDEIFHLFRRLHRPQEYPGVGLGLALVNIVVKHHGGEIDVLSDVDSGCQMVVKLPRADA